MLALPIRCEWLIAEGEIADYAELAQLRFNQIGLCSGGNGMHASRVGPHSKRFSQNRYNRERTKHGCYHIRTESEFPQLL
jgi:hypothetical protein